MKITKARLKQIIKEEFEREYAPVDHSEFGDLYDLWVGVGDDLRQAGAVDETFFERGSDYDFILNQLKYADDPNGPMWQEDDDEEEDSGYAMDFGFPKLTNNQQDAIGIIKRLERDLGYRVPHGFKGFKQVVEWIKDLEPPVDYTGKP